MPSHKLRIAEISECPTFDSLVGELIKLVDKRDVSCGVIAISAKPDNNNSVKIGDQGSICLEFFFATPLHSVNEEDGKPIYYFPPNTRAKCNIEVGDRLGRIEITSGPNKSLSHLEHLIRNVCNLNCVIAECSTGSPVDIFRKVQKLFEKTGGSVIKSLRFMEYSPVDGSIVSATARVKEDQASEDTLGYFQKNAAIQSIMMSFKTAQGKAKLTVSNAANFRFTCSEKTKLTVEMLCRKIAWGQEMSEQDLEQFNKPQAS